MLRKRTNDRTPPFVAGKIPPFKVHASLRPVFRKIGIPFPVSFTPDPFQVEALEKLRSTDVLVSAPTGAGKTWIAVEAIKRSLAQGKRAWYTSPLKALSNSKYEEFRCEFGPNRVGILTGDRKENPNAPVIVGTTEILRNQLYDAMSSSTDIEVDLVVIDEAHYLSDVDRGVVWEEVLIYLPGRVQLLLLSATLQNGDELARWLMEIRDRPCAVVDSRERPVPLVPLFLSPDNELLPLRQRGKILPRVQEIVTANNRSKLRRTSMIPDYGTLIRHLRVQNLLPAIFFLKSRTDCDSALSTCLPAPPLPPQQEIHRQELLKSSFDQFSFLSSHPHLPSLLEYRVGSHHAGLLPQWKILVEKMMNGGFLEAIFSTSTVAAGVNFPTRTVALVQSDRYNGREFVNLTATELHQMTGRAGRRGMDKVGFALVLPGAFQNPVLIHDLLASEPEPIRSQIQITFSMVLNLLLSHRPEDIKPLLNLSLATFQDTPRDLGTKRKQAYLKKRIALMVPHHRCTLDRPDTIRTLPRRRDKTATGTLPCATCVHLNYCHFKNYKRLTSLFHRLLKVTENIDTTHQKLWLDFQRHLSFLKKTGFVGQDDKLTDDGIWASRLRLDQPLLIAEGIRQNVFRDIAPEVLAGLVAVFVTDNSKEIDIHPARLHELKPLVNAFNHMVARLHRLRALKIRQGFPTTPLKFWPAAALFLWAKGLSWSDLLGAVSLEEGDMVMLILRTADHLRQISDLDDTHPALAQTSRRLLPSILREPVLPY